MHIRPWRPRLALNTILLVLLIAVLAPDSAAPIVAAAQALSVDGSDLAASDSTCAPCKSIQGAINLAGPGDGITVAPGTYPETLTITRSVSITGGVPLLPDEQGPTIVDAGGTASVVTIPNAVPPDVLVSLTGLTLTDGIAPGSGGGIAAPGGMLSLSDTTIMSNTATDSGGGIYASNAVTLTHSPVMSNTARGAGGYGSGIGGGIYGNNAITLSDSPVTGNTAGYNGGGICGNVVTLTDSPVMSNTATNRYGFGGGIAACVAGGPVTLTDSPVMSNTAGTGGGISCNCAVTLTDSPVVKNTATYRDGGGIFSDSTVTLMGSPVMSNTAAGYGGGLVAYGAVLVLTSTIAGNTASYGGGLAAYEPGSTLTITNSTVSANSATTSGGAIASWGTSLTVSFSTISANSAPSGGGIAVGAGNTTTLNATILAGNTAPSGPDCAGAVTSLGDNLIGNADGCSGFSAPGDLTGSGASPLDPRLGPLADNGGPTLTQALLPGSPALDVVPLTNCAVRTDQRGQPRPDALYSGACDSGAVEVPAVAPPATPTRTPTSTPIATNTPTSTPPPPPPTSQPTSTAPPVVVVPTSTPTSGATSTPPQGLVATSTATATLTRPGATATRVPASPCRRALPLHVRLASGTVRSTGAVVIRARTVSRARLSLVVGVLAKKTVVTGTGTQRRRVVRTIVLYRARATGRADARGRFQGQVRVTYKAARPTRALLTITAQAGCAATTARLLMTILPRRRH